MAPVDMPKSRNHPAEILASEPVGSGRESVDGKALESIWDLKELYMPHVCMHVRSSVDQNQS